jgi:hypothetical protein
MGGGSLQQGLFPSSRRKFRAQVRKNDVQESALTLPGKVDAPEEASLPWGVQDVQEKKSKTFHERVQG